MWVGAPLSRLLLYLERKALGGLAGIHKTGLRDPEEDYLAMAPWLGCFLLILPFGDARCGSLLIWIGMSELASAPTTTIGSIYRHFDWLIAPQSPN